MEVWVQIVTLCIAVISVLVAIFSIYYAKESRDIAKVAKDASVESAKASTSSAETAKIAVGEGFRPYVIVKLYALDLKLHFEIVNLGNRTAYQIEIEIEPNFRDLLELKSFKTAVIGVEKMLQQKSLYPGQSLVTVLAKNKEYLTLKKESVSDIREINVKYNSIPCKSMNSFEFDQNYDIDIRSFLFKEKIATESTQFQLSIIAKILEKISKTLKITNSPFKTQSKTNEDGNSNAR